MVYFHQLNQNMKYEIFSAQLSIYAVGPQCVSNTWMQVIPGGCKISTISTYKMFSPCLHAYIMIMVQYISPLLVTGVPAVSVCIVIAGVTLTGN